MAIFFLILFVLPFLEIYVLISVGSLIGFVPTVVLVLGLSLLGAAILRQQGTAALFKAQAALANGQMPLDAMLDGAGLTLAAGLLITPGLITDAMGFALLVPSLRRWLLHWAFGRLLAGHVFGPGQPSKQPDPKRNAPKNGAIEGDFRRLDD